MDHKYQLKGTERVWCIFFQWKKAFIIQNQREFGQETQVHWLDQFLLEEISVHEISESNIGFEEQINIWVIEEVNIWV